MRKYPGEKFFWLGCQKSFCCAKSCLTIFEELIIGWTLSGYKKSACRVSKHSRKLNWTQRVSLQNIQEHSRNPERRGLLGHWRSLVFPADTMGKHLKGWRGGCHKNKTFFGIYFHFLKSVHQIVKLQGESLMMNRIFAILKISTYNILINYKRGESNGETRQTQSQPVNILRNGPTWHLCPPPPRHSKSTQNCFQDIRVQNAEPQSDKPKLRVILQNNFQRCQGHKRMNLPPSNVHQ